MALKVDLDAKNITGVSDGSPVGTWTDASGNGFNGTQATSSKQPIYRANGGNPYLEFDGVDDFINIGYGINTSQALTIYVRLYSTETGSTYRNVYDGPSTTQRTMIWFDSTGKVEYDIGDGRSATAQRGQWVSVALTHGAGTVLPTYYLNGATVPDTGAAYIIGPSWTPSWFNRGGANTWKGYVARVRIYDHVLTAAEIAALDAAPGASGTASLNLGASGAVGATASGTASLSLGASGTPSASASGTASLNLGAVAGALAGTAGLNLAATGTALAVLAASGSATLTLTASGSAVMSTGGTAVLTLTAGGVALALYETDTSNTLDGLDLLLTATVTMPVAIAPAPTGLAERYDVAIPYPVPVMVDGRPT